jgi:hypothetical protein
MYFSKVNPHVLAHVVLLSMLVSHNFNGMDLQTSVNGNCSVDLILGLSYDI